jgi:hypothetical protein
MLERMSLRTTPSMVNTFGPFVPSPGYGPPVSSGIGSRLPVAAVVAAVDDDEAAVDEDEVAVEPVVAGVVEPVPAADDELVDDFESLPHAARRALAPMPARALSAVRRLKG